VHEDEHRPLLRHAFGNEDIEGLARLVAALELPEMCLQTQRERPFAQEVLALADLITRCVSVESHLA